MNDISYEDQLGDALEKLLEEGAADSESLASGLNKLGMSSPSGDPWTSRSLEREFKRLSA